MSIMQQTQIRRLFVMLAVAVLGISLAPQLALRAQGTPGEFGLDGLEAQVAPLTTVGNALVYSWEPSGDEMTLYVPEESYVRLYIYSPGINLADDFGDERYDTRTLDAEFTLSSAQTQTILKQARFSLEPHSWLMLYEGVLQAGNYSFRSFLYGNGKNAFIIRPETDRAGVGLYSLLPSFNISRTVLSRTYHFSLGNQQLAEARARGGQCVLGLYDADGPDELEATVTLPSGQTQPMPISGELQWDDMMIDQVGRYTLSFRKPNEAYQRSNTVRLRLLCGGIPQALPIVIAATTASPAIAPVEVQVIDTQGRLLPDVPYTVQGRYTRYVTLGAHPGYSYVDTLTSSGEILTPQQVRFGMMGGAVTYVLEAPRAAAPPPRPAPVPVPVCPMPQPTCAPAAPPTIYPIRVSVIDVEGNPFDVDYRIDGEGTDTRYVTVGTRDGCELVETRIFGGFMLDRQQVRFGPPGGEVVFVFKCYEPEPVVDIPEPIIPPEPVIAEPVPPVEPVVEDEGQPRFRVYRQINPNPALIGDIIQVDLIVENEGTALGSYTLTDLLPPNLDLEVFDTDVERDGMNLIWTGSLEPEDRQVHTYYMRSACTTPTSFNWQALFEPEAEDADRIIPGALILNALEVLIQPLGDVRTLMPGDTFEVRAVVANPTGVEVTTGLRVQTRGLRLVDGAERLSIPAEGNAMATYRFEVLEEGDVRVEITPEIEGVGCRPSEFDVVVQPLPELPPQRVRTVLAFETFVEGLTDVERSAFLVKLPREVSYVADTAEVDGITVEPPRVYPTDTGDILVFEYEGVRAQLSFEVLQDGNLLVEEEDTALLVLDPLPMQILGFAGAIEAYEAALRPQQSVRNRDRVGALILSPNDEFVFTRGNIINVRADMPADTTSFSLSVNGVPVPSNKLGGRRVDPALDRLTIDYVAVRLDPGPNQLRLESVSSSQGELSDTITLYTSTKATQAVINPISELIADSATPLRFEILLRDAYGNVPAPGFITVDTDGATPMVDDAQTTIFGYQLAHNNGRAVLELEPLNVPDDLNLRVFLNDLREMEASDTLADFDESDLAFSQRFVIGSDFRPWILNGFASAGVTWDFDSGVFIDYSGEFFARGTLFDTFQVTLAANAKLEPLGYVGNPYERFPVQGSSGEYTNDARSRAGYYVRIENNLTYLQYGDFNTDFQNTAFGINRNYTGLAAEYRNERFFARAYATFSRVGDQVNLAIPADGTSFYRLQRGLDGYTNIRKGSLTVEIVKINSDNDQRITDDLDPLVGKLEELRDYRINYDLGYLRFIRGIPSRDAFGNSYVINVSFRTLDPNGGERKLRAGGQVGYNFLTFDNGNALSAQVTAYQEDDGEPSTGATQVVAGGVNANLGALTARAEVAYGRNDESGGLAVSAGLRYGVENFVAQLDYSYYTQSFRSANILNANGAGQSLRAKANYSIGVVDLELDGRYRSYSAGSRAGTNDYGLMALAGFGLGGDRGFITNPRAKLGVEVNTVSLPRIVAGISGEDVFGIRNVDFDITHLQSINDKEQSVTDFKVSHRLFGNVDLDVIDRVVWGSSNSVIIGLSSNFETADLLGFPAADFGTTRVYANYTVPGGVSFTAGRFLVGVSTSYPINEVLTIDGGVDQVIDLDNTSQNSTTVNLGLRLDTTEVDASLGYEFRISPSGIKQVINGSTTVALNDRFYVNASAGFLSDQQGRGFRFAVSAAYRGRVTTLLTKNEATFGEYDRAKGTSVRGDWRLTIPFNNRLAFRSGYAYRYLAGTGYQDRISLGFRVFMWQGGALELYGGIYHDWTKGFASDAFAFGATIELSQHIACGLTGVIAYSFGGVSDPIFGRQGLQLRLDIALDEQFICLSSRDNVAVVREVE